MSIVLLGSTGSIGTNTLALCQKYGIEVEALVAGNNVALLNKQIAQCKPHFVATATKQPAITHSDYFYDDSGIEALLEKCQSNLVINAITGFAGLRFTLKALEMGKQVALANKESLVIAGKFLDTSKIIAIDSEHFGLWYLLRDKVFDSLYITASGGAFRDHEPNRLKDATYKEALKHPNWSMGDKITIDSATMVNKLFELLEAKWLFGTDCIDAVIERNSLVHALIAHPDGSLTAHIAKADMKLPIAYALGIKSDDTFVEPLTPLELNTLCFEKIETSRYPMWQIKEHLLANPDMGVVLNASSEAALDHFRKDRVRFFGYIEMILDTYRAFDNFSAKSIEDLYAIDKEVRSYVNAR